jgi:hypothetical protein
MTRGRCGFAFLPVSQRTHVRNFVSPVLLSWHVTRQARGRPSEGAISRIVPAKAFAREISLRVARELLVVPERLDATVGHQITAGGPFQ